MNLETLEWEIYDAAKTLALVFVAVVVPGILQMRYGVSALKLTTMVVVAYLAVHLVIVQVKHDVRHRNSLHLGRRGA